LLERYTTTLAGRFSTQTLGPVLLTIATLHPSKTIAIFLAVPEFVFFSWFG